MVKRAFLLALFSYTSTVYWCAKPTDLNISDLLSFLHNNSITSLQLQKVSGGLSSPIVYKASCNDLALFIKGLERGQAGIHETTYAQHGASLGIAPKLYTTTPNFIVTDFIEGKTLTPRLLENSQAGTQILRNVATSLKTLHMSKAPLKTIRDIFSHIYSLYSLLSVTGSLKEKLDRAISYLKIIQAKMERVPIGSTPCHNDLHPRNIVIDSNNRVFFLDWQIASISNPFYDLAYFIINNALTPTQERLFLEFYCPELLIDPWISYLEDMKQVVRLTDALTIFAITQDLDPVALTLPYIKPINPMLRYYLEQFAENSSNDSAGFFYGFAWAFLEAYYENCNNR
ncbi:MAG TPA: phosphotransferase [Candidatus Babeliaceae bacterium]|nr:phosphotransferase [Candidatus Babeliaceae bacterium]